MLMVNGQGESVYYNLVTKHGEERYVIRAASGQYILGRDRQKAKSRTFTQEHQAESFLRRHGYKAR